MDLADFISCFLRVQAIESESDSDDVLEAEDSEDCVD